MSHLQNDTKVSFEDGGFFCFLFKPLLWKIMASLPVLEAALSRLSARLWGIVEPSLMYSAVCYIAIYKPGGFYRYH